MIHQGLIKPGETRNPTGLNGANTHTRRLEIIKALHCELNEPCEQPGFEHLTKFEFGIKTLIALYMNSVPWAVKEVNTRLFGRVPFQLAASFSMNEGPDLSALTVAELTARARAIADAAAGVVDGEAVRLVAPDGVSSPSGLQPSTDGAALTAPQMEAMVDTPTLDQMETLPDEATLDAMSPAELKSEIARLEQLLLTLPPDEEQP